MNTSELSEELLSYAGLPVSHAISLKGYTVEETIFLLYKFLIWQKTTWATFLDNDFDLL